MEILRTRLAILLRIPTGQLQFLPCSPPKTSAGAALTAPSSPTNGCWYEAGKDSRGAAYFGYVVLTPVETYEHQPLYKNVAVSGLGRSAYFNNGADARQLWVKVNDQLAFVVAFGDEPREDGATAIARLVLAAMR